MSIAEWVFRGVMGILTLLLALRLLRFFAAGLLITRLR